MTDRNISLKSILDRFAVPFTPDISCGPGWEKLLCALEAELAEIDPSYVVYQVKEKLGTLRFYYAPSSPDKAGKIDKVIRRYEALSASTCEETGQPGRLMVRNGVFRTLNDSFMAHGWEPVEREG